MIAVLKTWYEKHFSDPQAVILALIILTGAALIFFWGGVLAPVLASIVIAYVLEGLVKKISFIGVPRILSVAISFFLFLLPWS